MIDWSKVDRACLNEACRALVGQANRETVTGRKISEAERLPVDFLDDVGPVGADCVLWKIDCLLHDDPQWGARVRARSWSRAIAREECERQLRQAQGLIELWLDTAPAGGDRARAARLRDAGRDLFCEHLALIAEVVTPYPGSWRNDSHLEAWRAWLRGVIRTVAAGAKPMPGAPFEPRGPEPTDFREVEAVSDMPDAMSTEAHHPELYPTFDRQGHPHWQGHGTIGWRRIP